jgi:hypothetical protein
MADAGQPCKIINISNPTMNNGDGAGLLVR